MHKDHELHKRRRGRNTAVLIAAVTMVVMIFAVTIVKLGPDIAIPWTQR